jgi:hypothetical protein
MNERHAVLHAVAIKKHAAIEDITRLARLNKEVVAKHLDAAKASARVIEVQGKYALSPLMSVALAGDYSRQYAHLRTNKDFMSAYEAFERINVQLKALITEWQTITVGGQRIANDHSNKAHDEKVIGDLGSLHERAEGVLDRLSKALPRLKYYSEHLEAALEKSEKGDIKWVSDVKIDSYHTVWFELHEDLLRIVGKQREE